jgi:hypothetical protein
LAEIFTGAWQQKVAPMILRFSGQDDLKKFKKNQEDN